MTHALQKVSAAREWEAYHALREQVLWSRPWRSDLPPYDRAHPDETAEGNTPFLLSFDGEAIGTIRVDVRPPIAWLRLVAIREDLQGAGHGTRMVDLAIDFARAEGCNEIRSNVDASAIGFYERLGFTPMDPGSPLSLHKTV